jgi:hypothetical protein
MKKYNIILLCIFLFSCNSDVFNKPSREENNKRYFEMSVDEKLKLCKEKIANSNLRISDKFDIEIPENSIFYIPTDTSIWSNPDVINSLCFPIIIRFSDRKVRYGGNRFEEAGLSKADIGATYHYGNYAGEGMARDVQIYQLDMETDSIVPISAGLTTNNLGGYDYFNFSAMEEGNLARFELDYFNYLKKFGDLADKISQQKVKLENNKCFLFYSNGKITDKFNGVYLAPRVGPRAVEESELLVEKSELPVESDSVTRNKEFYHIQDPDGYTNLRDGENGNVIRKVYPNESFIILESSGDYFIVQFEDGNRGYIHKSRVDQKVN